MDIPHRSFAPVVRETSPKVRLLLKFGLCFIVAFLAFTARAVTRTVTPPQTIQSVINASQSGDIVSVNPGTYREQISPKAGVTIQGKSATDAPNIKIKGSDVVTGWVSAGSGRFVKNGWAVNSQQVFINGVLQRQIGGVISTSFDPYWIGRIGGDENSMAVGDFHYDIAAQKLYIKPSGGSITGKTIEVSVRNFLVYTDNVSSHTLRDLTFLHSNASSAGRAPAIRIIGNNVRLERLTVTLCDSTAVVCRGNDNTVVDSKFNTNGQLGLGGSGTNYTILRNEAKGNNTRGFDTGWEAGGMKFIGAEGLTWSTISNNKLIDNRGAGLWIDGGAYPKNLVQYNTLADNVAAYNDVDGLFYEVGLDSDILRNYCFGNGVRGIYVSGRDNLIQDNLTIKNSQRGITVALDPRLPGGPVNNFIQRNVTGWNTTHELTIPAFSYPTTSNYNLFLHDTNPKIGSQGVGTWTGLPAWQSASGKDGGSWQQVGAMNSTLASQLAAKNPAPNWSSVESIARSVDTANPPEPWEPSVGGPLVFETDPLQPSHRRTRCRLYPM